MKILTSFLVLLYLTILQTPVEMARDQFPAIESLEQANNFIDQLKEENSPEGKGYNAAMVFMKSRFVKNPFTKLKYFKKGKNILDATILENPSNIEIRYIRYLMQKQIPAFLGYKDNLEEDFKIITSKILESTLKNKFKKKILNNMLGENLNDELKNEINKIICQL